ncbi:MAG: MOSC domain-containing protein [Actinomycetota bacterium]
MTLEDGVEQILGVRPPDDVPVGQWLAGRNLGLVPVADPASFAWPGYWLGRSGDEIVLMYGSPSGPVDVELDGPVEEGWVIAALDLDYVQPGETGEGVVEALLVAPAAEAPMERVESAVAVAGHGLEGDRYRDGRGTFGGRGQGYELTLVAAEHLDDLGIAAQRARRNVVTRGIDLNALVGRRFAIGEVECVARRLAEPCAHLERVEGKGLLRPLVHRAGIRADILAGGTISLGDRVRPL